MADINTRQQWKQEWLLELFKLILAQEHRSMEIILHTLVSDQAGDQASHSFQ